MAELDDFPAYSRLADQLIDRATKDQLGDVARLLALNIGYYQQRYGDVPQETLLKMVRAETLDCGWLRKPALGWRIARVIAVEGGELDISSGWQGGAVGGKPVGGSRVSAWR